MTPHLLTLLQQFPIYIQPCVKYAVHCVQDLWISWEEGIFILKIKIPANVSVKVLKLNSETLK